MEIIEKKIDELIPYENNPRINDGAVEYVANSIREFGFKVPVVIDQHNTVVCGHTRLKAAKKLNLIRIPCVVADDLTEEQVRAYRLADNKAGESSSWDLDLLDIELDSIETLDMTDFGFDHEEPETVETQKVDPGEDDLFSDIEKMETHYGVPYQGNKSRIADIIISILPKGRRLVDLFGGGGAITHCAMLSGKWENYLYNDLNPMITTLFMDAVNGKYHDEHRVITREDFESLKDTDAYVKYIWSFGNNGTEYLWGKDSEEFKINACHMLMDETVAERRASYRTFCRSVVGKIDYRLEPPERLQSIEHLEALQRLEASHISYMDYEYQDGDIVYCDVPYEQKDTKKCDDYGVQFNSQEFYEWAKSRPYQVYFSSYEISDKDFYSVKVKSVMSLMGATTNGQKVNEFLYSNREIKTD